MVIYMKMTSLMTPKILRGIFISMHSPVSTEQGWSRGVVKFNGDRAPWRPGLEEKEIS